MKKILSTLILVALVLSGCESVSSVPEETDSRSPQLQLFEDGNYALFMHFGLYSKMEGVWKGKAYRGNAEWIMNGSQAGIPYEEYMAEADTFNPCEFDADAIAQMAKDAGMKYIVITSKHHEGYAMFDSDACDFNVHDRSAVKRDLIGELAAACHEKGIGIGFYYSQFQDWTAPGGGGGGADDGRGLDEADLRLGGSGGLRRIFRRALPGGPMDFPGLFPPGLNLPGAMRFRGSSLGGRIGARGDAGRLRGKVAGPLERRRGWRNSGRP